MSLDLFGFIRTNRYLLDQIIDIIPTPIFIKDSEGRYIDCNNAFTELLSVRREEIIGKTVYEIWAREEADIFFKQDNDLFAKGGTQVYETNITSSSGSKLIVQFYKQVFTDPDGMITGFLGVIFDITDRKNKEAEINRLLKEKETILREAHHRIKNNMNSVLGLISLRTSDKTPKEAKNILDEAQSHLVGMCTLYDKLYQAPSTEQIDLDDYLASLFKEVISVINNGISIKAEIHIPRVRISSESAANLGIIFNELITNSIKYAFETTADPRITLNGEIAENKIILDYKDNGIGLPADFSINSDPGFGMTIIKGLVKNIPGEIDPVPADTGAFFRIKIPAHC